MLVDFQASKILINCGIVDHVISNPVAHDVGESGALGNDRGTHPPEDDDANIRGLLSTTLLRLLHSPPPKKKKKKKNPNDYRLPRPRRHFAGPQKGTGQILSSSEYCQDLSS